MVERSVLLRRGPDSVGLGFSLLGTPNLPPIIYDILENSPAADSGEVSFQFCTFYLKKSHSRLPVLPYFSRNNVEIYAILFKMLY